VKTALRTELCERLGIEVPVILAGMGPVASGGEPVATAELAAAVSQAGGLGVIGGVAYSPDALRAEIRKVRALTDRPFGVDLLLSSNFLIRGGAVAAPPTRDELPKPALDAVRALAEELEIPWLEAPATPAIDWIPPDKSYAEAQLEVVLEERVPVFASGLGSPAPFREALHAHGATILSLVGNTRAARRVAEGGADIVVAQGTEAGGHTGRIGTLALLPQVMDVVAPLPVVAAGGIASGRALAGVLALGAVGAWCGTAFLVAEEANQPEIQKQRILAAAAEDTVVTRLYSGKTMRNITNPLIEAWERSAARALPMGLQGLLIRDLVHSIRMSGREELLMNAAGQTSGMLQRIRPAAEILDELVHDAARCLAGLSGRVEAVVGA
jgi:NAD(P)H-dependent flavin oxidoreductase YrpB (nitropropane dioxygenase family)